MDAAAIIDLAERVGLPVLSLFIGNFWQKFRTRQRKEADILDNVKQILELQKNYITEQDGENKKTRDINKRLEAKLDGKNKAIRRANWCKFTNEGEGCPVLLQEEKNDDYDKCDTCKYNQEEK